MSKVTGVSARFRHAIKQRLSIQIALVVLITTLGVPLGATNVAAATAGSGNCAQTYTLSSGTGTLSVTEDSGYCYVAFKNTGAVDTQTTFSWSRPSMATNVDILVVGGGGGGASRHGGGGGGGAYVETTSYAISSASSVSVIVGSGGRGGPGGTTYQGSSGQTSSFKSGSYGLTALGGGYGSYNVSASNGGSGGGAGWSQTAGTVTSQSQTTFANASLTGITFGNSGNNGANENDSSNDYWAGGGGGGAGAAGENPKYNGTQTTAFGTNNRALSVGGKGGVGKTPSWISTTVASALTIGEVSGSSVYFAGGGGGGMGADGSAGGPGGLGGGATGTRSESTGNNGTANTGGGGGGSGFDDIGTPLYGVQNPEGGDGGSGIVVIRYAAYVGSSPCAQTVGSPTGVSVSTSGSDCIVSFTSTGSNTWTAPANVTAVRVLLVGAGGGGDRGVCGVYWGHGGGGGQVKDFYTSVTAGTAYSLSVGTGGTASGACGTQAGNGSSSSLVTSVTFSADGGKAAIYNAGTGGHSGLYLYSGGTPAADANLGAGGGAGAGGHGSTINGGPGISSNITGSAVMYGSGGAGYNSNGWGSFYNTSGTYARATVGTATANSGMGGAEGPTAGADGIVVIRYTQFTTCNPESSTNGNSTVLQFKNIGSCTWTVPNGVSSLSAVLVGGGGGGGSWAAGGGGGGGVVSNSSVSVTSGNSYTISIGPGGLGSLNSGSYLQAPTYGASTTAFGLTAYGGGYGGSYSSYTTGALATSGGAGINSGTGTAVSVDGTISPAQGYAGGTATGNATYGFSTGGGGGAGGLGGNAVAGQAGAGGAGISTTITGSTLYFGGGGGGGCHDPNCTVGAGGTGGGGSGSQHSNTSYASSSATSGTANTGGGGGGGGAPYESKGAEAPTYFKNGFGGTGGSGILIVSYVSTYSITYAAGIGGTGSGPSTPTSVGLASTFTTPANTYTRTGYTFAGWSDGTNTYAAGATYPSSGSVTSDVTLTATWTVISCSPTVTTPTGYTVYSFTTTGTCTWTVPNGVSNVDVLVVGGGGGGGYAWDNSGGGGGGGGQAKSTNITLSSTSTITVGSGGSGGISSSTAGTAGSDSSISTITSLGGTGGCASRSTCTNSGRPASATTAAVGGSGGAGGANGYGGGGSNTSGTTTNSTTGGTGTTSQMTLTSTVYGTGGAGGIRQASANVPGEAGASNTGNGGSGGGAKSSSGTTATGGAGGSGIIVVRVANTQTITYAAGTGGSGSAPTSPTTVSYGSTFTTPANTYTRTGYTFAGWSDGTNTYAASARYPSSGSVSGNVTLTATWSANTQTITYAAGTGGSGSAPTSPTTVSYGSTFTTPANTYTRTGYTFAGWSDGTNTYAASATYPSSGSVSGNVTLTATWTANTQTITYSAGTGGSGSAPTSPTTVSYGSTFTTPANTYTRTGYTFAGWSDGTDTYAASATYPSSGSVSGNVTLTATWSANTYTVTYNSNGGSSVTDGSFSSDGSISSAPTAPTRAGFTFAGWSATDGGSTISFPYSPGVTTNITLYGKWTASTQTVDYSVELSGLSGTYGTTSSTTVIPSTGAFTVEAWFNASANNSNNANAVLVSQGSNSAQRFYVKRDVNGQIVIYRSGAAAEVGCGSTGSSAWHHVAVTYNGSGTTSCYLNGQLRATMSSSTAISSTFAVGAYAYDLSTRSTTWIGKIDEVRVYSAARTSSEIQTDLKTYGPTNTSSLVAYYDFNEGSGTTAYNQKINASESTDLTFSSAPTWADIASTSLSGTSTVVTFPRSYLNNSGGWATPNNVSSVTTLVVGGGGGGGGGYSGSVTDSSGGGGGGGAYLGTSYPVSGVMNITVGYAGSGGLLGSTSSGREGTVGGTSTFGSITAGGGGGGGCSSSPGSNVACNSGTQQHGVNGTAGGGGGGSNNFLSAYNYGSGGTGSSVTVGSTTYAGQNGFRGGYYNDGGSSQTGYGGPGGGARSAANFNTVGSGLSSSITGSSVEYGRGGSTYGVSGWTYSANASGYGTGGSGARVSSGTTTNGGNGAGGVVIVSYVSGYSISYAAGSGTGSAPTSPTYVAFSSTFTTPANTYTRTGYTFAGWSDGTDTYAASATYPSSGSVSGNVTLTATWSANTQTITYAAGTGGSGSAPTSPTTVSYGSTFTTPANTYTRTGYTFAGWSDGTDTYAASATYPSSGSVSGNVTLTATWSANTQTITYAAGTGGSGSAPTSPTTVSYGSTFTTPANTYTRTGYTFAGWSDGTNTYAASARYPSSGSVSGNVTLTATWSANTQTITYAAGTGGSGSAPTSPTTVSYGSTFTTPANTYTRTGYTFAGWSDGTNTYAASATYPSSGSVSGNVTLTATWTANTQTITYSAGTGGSGSAPTSPTTVSYGSTFTTPANTYTRTGYTFAGWSDGTDTYAASATYPSSGSVSGNVTLTATWSANSNTVTFNSNYGTPTTSTQSIASGTSTALTSNSFTRTGYTFGGWNTLADGSGTSYTNGQSVTIYAPVTLYAKWTVITYTVTYSATGQTSGSPEKVTDAYTIETGALSLSTTGTMVKTGYTFDGWYTASTGGSKVGNAAASYTPTADITLHARWSANSYAITYYDTSKTGGSAPSAANYTTGGSAVSLSGAGTLVRSGYTFGGWNTKIDGTGTSYAEGNSLTPSAPVNLYPKWTAVNYTVTYDTQNKTSGSAPTDSTNYNIGNSVTVKGNSGTLARTGYTFAGWTDNSSGTGTVYLSGDTYTVSTANITFYPKWTANTYNISYNTNGALSGSPSRNSDTYTTGTSGISLPNIGTMVRTGYDFSGWSTSPTGSAHSGAFTTTSDVILYAIWTLKTINYSYARGTADGTTLTSSNIATFPNPSSSSGLYGSTVTINSTISTNATVSTSSYLFFGWSDGNTTYQRSDSYILGETAPTFTAQWIRLYEVRYGLSGGTGIVDVDSECAQANNTCTANQSISLSAAPTRSGYTFSGWKDQSNATFAAGATTNITSTSYVFYAQWTAVDYSISFDSIGGSNSPATQTKNIGQTVTLPSPGTRTGYDFDGWTVGGVTYGVGTTYTVGSSNAAFTALWTAQRYNVSYDWNGGAGTPTASSVYTYGNAAITLPTGSGHSKDGYVFDGWALTNGGTALGLTHTPTSDVQYIARWIDGSYTITYDAVGGTLSSSTETVTRANAFTLATPTRTGYTFDGWYEDSNNTVSYGAAGASKTPTSSRTIYAKWVQNSLVGITPAHLNSLTSITTQSGSSNSWTGSHALSGTGASLSIPADALPNGTVVQVSFVEDLSRPASLIGANYAYYTSVVLHWQLGTGSTATVPTAASGKPLTLTLTNPDIREGAKIYKIIQGVATQVATATTDGSVSIEITEDPEIVVAATTPTAPRSVTATGNLNAQATVSWSAPLSTGGSAVQSYTVTSSPGSQTCTANGATSCTVTGLTNDTSYTFTVIATNAVGNSTASSASNAVIPRLNPTFNAVFDSKGGTSISDTLFTQPGTLSAPTEPTKPGYTFGGWMATDGDPTSVVSFPYSPGVNSDITLYALWTAVSSGGSGGSSGGGSNSSAPTVSPIVNTPTTSRVDTQNRNPLINMPQEPTIYNAPQTAFPELRNAPYPTNGINVPVVGEVIGLINREPVEVVVTPQQTQTVIEIGNSLSVTLTPQTISGEGIEVGPNGALTVLKGAFISAEGDGFKANSPVEAWLYSDPIRLDSGLADSEGNFENKFAIGHDVPLGKHTIVLNGLTPDGEVVTLALGVQVKDPVVDTLPLDDPSSSIFTQTFRVVAALIFALVLGALLYMAARRRRTEG